ncbi:MAG: sigma-54-dependent Fis family transcriptional regulator [Deltaproteobacteria bacterium]|nr:sigma-54-dependent Fis family transcriptional regulator [Deltaproteobacteria bacterium]
MPQAASNAVRSTVRTGASRATCRPARANENRPLGRSLPSTRLAIANSDHVNVLKSGVWYARRVNLQRVLLLGPDDDARRALHLLLDRRGLAVAAVSDLDAAKKHIDGERCECVIAASELAPAIVGDVPVIGVVAERDVAAVIALLDAGIDDVLCTPIDEVAIALALRHLRPRDRRAPAGADMNLVGDGPAMAKLKHVIRTVAPTRTTVLIQGESGTGKELVARAIHELSPRAGNKFVAVNCAAIPGPLLESELFGHVRGAFTDAVRDKPGLFEEADGGTLFLDEVGELPLALQSKLLRALQESEIRRVGGEDPIKIDVRVIAATLRDLRAESEAGRFREDLYYRLAVVPVAVPALRDRVEDIEELARFFVARHAARHGREGLLGPEAIAALEARAWPGNVRELENVLERAVVLSEGPAIEVEQVAGKAQTARGAGENGELSIKKATRSLEEELIRRALGVTSGNRTNAAKLLEISHRALLYKMKEYGIS